MTHPVTRCPEAANLLREVWNSTQRGWVDVFQMGWYEAIQEGVKELQSQPEYQMAFRKYTAHRDTCPVCGEALQELNECHV